MKEKGRFCISATGKRGIKRIKAEVNDVREDLPLAVVSEFTPNVRLKSGHVTRRVLRFALNPYLKVSINSILRAKQGVSTKRDGGSVVTSINKFV